MRKLLPALVLTICLPALLSGQTTRPATTGPDGPDLEQFYEKPMAIAGVRTVEGRPTNGLRWRLRMSTSATATQPDRLIVWLHPSGGSMNNVVEPWAPNLTKRGYALLVMTAKNWAGWTTADAAKLNDTLADVARVEGVNPDQPILFGYSAGGQLALMLWYHNPEKFGGLILDAAYPVLPSKTPGRMAIMPPPKNEAVKDCPIFVLVGERDGGANAWRLAEDAYSRAGVPMVVHYVAGQGHAWLFGGVQRDRLFSWLVEVGQGGRPGKPVAEVATTQPAGPRKPIRMRDVY